MGTTFGSVGTAYARNLHLDVFDVLQLENGAVDRPRDLITVSGSRPRQTGVCVAQRRQSLQLRNRHLHPVRNGLPRILCIHGGLNRTGGHFFE